MTSRKPHRAFRRIILYCKLMNYNVNDILKMSDQELKIWYNRVLDMTSNETDFRIKTGMNIVDGRVNKEWLKDI